MDQKRLVRYGISLCLLSIGILFFNIKKTKSDNQRYKKSLQVQKKDSSRSQLNNKNPTSVQCKNLRLQFEKNGVLDKIGASWINHYLEKDGIEYVLRIERGTNNQNIEVQKINFYKLDQDGFPQHFSHFRDKTLTKNHSIKKIIDGYKVIQINDVHVIDQYLIERTNKQIKKIKNQSMNSDCNY